jgi:hypothetical protein
MPALANIVPPRYRNPRPIGVGGMGEIFCATDRELGREVALKILAARYAQDAALRARFEREALAAARLSGTPNIVTIFDVTEHAGRPIIVMEYLPGGSLDARIAGSPCAPAQALAWLEEAASALDAAHVAGVVHRDVKPANLLLDGRGHIHVADFGIASAAGLDSFTQTGTILGTAGYLSPEQAKGERATAASDRYALAVVAWELLTGRRPFAATSATVEALAHVNAPVPSPQSANPALPRQLQPVFERGLAKDPAARYPRAAEFVGDLRRALDDAAGDTWVVTPLPPAAETLVTSGRGRTRTRRWWTVPLLALLLVVLLLAGIAAAVLGLAGRNDAAPQRFTVLRTITAPPRTVQETVTAPAATGASGQALNDTAFTKMRARDFAGALPLLEQAVAKLAGSGALVEAYADYNLAFTRVALGQCTDVIALLDRAEEVEGHRVEIDGLREQADRSCREKKGGRGKGGRGKD